MILGPANTTGKVDDAFLFIVVCCVILLAAVTACMVTFLVKYNRKRHPHPEHVRENVSLEIIWTVVPTILVLLMFYFGWVDFDLIRNPPRDAMTVQVTARQWSWLFTYENGRQEDVLTVPVGRPVKLLMTSVDVLHCLFIPAYRIKEDCVPGMTTHLWFTANATGNYDIFCTEYCGVGHSHMRSKLVAMAPADFQKWHAAPPGKAAADLGPRILQAKGCLGCHSLDGTAKVGPTLKGLIGRKETVTAGGRDREITVDASFVREHIVDPRKATVKGFPPVMPAIPMTDEELRTVMAYLEALK
ncbi:MAG: Cytochrome c oxidase subunit 2 precursor [Syntrophaceae bacterium PtaU1.Bin231]|nr:MAG: Cytochrome c oxidase subunit 2 precursor [Syntrophaceae bacterium PtaU1.Bin231]